jgi:hypothetical protein
MGTSTRVWVHFHIVPFYDWVEQAYFLDPLWPENNPDGSIYFTYITRAFIEYEVWTQEAIHNE